MSFHTNPQRTLRAPRTEANRAKDHSAIHRFERPTSRVMVLVWFLVFTCILAMAIV